MSDGSKQAANKAVMTMWENRRADYQRTQLESLRRSLQLTDQIISGRPDVRLRFSDVRPPDSQGRSGSKMDKSYSVACGETITINVKYIPKPTSPEGIANILGLDYHELAHVMLTPADRTVILNALQDKDKKNKTSQNFWPAFTILEEHRIETLMGARYPSLRKYFAYPVLSLLVKKTTSADMNTRHLLLHGRRYLPRKVRDTFREFFEKAYTPKAAREAEACIDEYRFLALTDKEAYNRAAILTNRFAELLDDLGITPPTPDHGDEQSTGSPNKVQDKKQVRQEHENMSKDAKADSSKQDEAEQKDPEYDGSDFNKDNQEGGDDNDGDSDDPSDGNDEQPESAESEPDEQSTGSGSGSDPQGKGKGDQGNNDRKSSGSGNSDSGGKGKQRSSVGTSQSPGKGGKSAGSGGGTDPIRKSPAPPAQPETLQPHQVHSAISQIMKDLLDDDEVNAEIKRYQSAMDESNDGLASVLGYTPEKEEKHFRSVTPEMFARSSALSDQLRQLWAKMEAGWNYGVEDGPRLNMMNAAMATEPEDYDTIYDDWTPGQQETSGTEVVIMGDRSGSMGGSRWATDDNPSLAKIVSQNIWEFMYALQEVDAKVTVLTYDGYCYTLYNRTENVTGAGWYELEGAGGTDPTSAFQEARRILTGSEMQNKLLVNFTDGGWGSSPEAIQESLDPLWDTVKVAILLGGMQTGSFRYKELFDIVGESSGDILDIISKAVIEIIQRSAGSL